LHLVWSKHPCGQLQVLHEITERQWPLQQNNADVDRISLLKDYEVTIVGHQDAALIGGEPELINVRDALSPREAAASVETCPVVVVGKRRMDLPAREAETLSYFLRRVPLLGL
jgi:hypothetical protein